jgi:heat shock protein HtpX
LDNVIEEMSIAAGLPKPKVYVIPDSDPNAFATGRDPEHASVAVTRGLLDALTRDELQGVVAHELSHVRNLDIRLMTIIAAMVGTIALLSDWTTRGLHHTSNGRSRSDRDDDKGAAGVILFVVWVVAILIAPLVGQTLAMMVSRRREYLADASGAELTRNPLALASALEKIDRAHEPTPSVKRGSAHLCIADPLGRAVGLRQGWVPDLLASHPPMANRITALRQMAYQAS